MSARRKLNLAFLNGSLLLALIAGLTTGSWMVFLVVLVASILGDVYARNLR